MSQDKGLRSFAANDKLFRLACELAATAPTRRQASKWHQGRGLAVRHKQDAKRQLDGVSAA